MTSAVACVCAHCGAPFLARARDLKRGGGRVCSRRCASVLGGRARAANQRGERNGNWKGGISANKVRYKRLFQQRYPDKARAQFKAAYAERRGRIVRDRCADCGASEDLHKHHDDYSRALEVVILCGRCHRIRHGASR